VRKKEAEVASTGNPLIRKRFEDALKKFRADLEVKMHEMTSARSRSLTQEAIRIERSKKSRAQWTLESAVCFGSISTSHLHGWDSIHLPVLTLQGRFCCVHGVPELTR
jgi:hypothetical protein